jgi:Holliday junction resolvase RusA-like endonuclease
VRLTLSYPPSGNYRLIYSCSVDPTHTVRVRLAPAVKAFREEVSAEGRRLGVRRLHGAVGVHVDAFCAGMLMDADNIAKVLLDACTGALWADDSQVVDLHVVIHNSGASPYLVVKARPLGGFD